jgi:hypothetical protein
LSFHGPPVLLQERPTQVFLLNIARKSLYGASVGHCSARRQEVTTVFAVPLLELGTRSGDALQVVSTLYRKARTMNATEHPGASNASEADKTPTVDMQFEVFVIPVTDVDQAKAFYSGLG